MRFTKVHGAGNDFIMLDAMEGPLFDYRALAPRLCHRQTGIGADGLLIAERSESSDIRMRIINKDGSEAEMCGNGIRAFAKYIYENKLIERPSFSVETLAGVMQPALIFNGNNEVTAVCVDMGRPSFKCEDIPVKAEGVFLNRLIEAAGRSFTVSAVRTGVPVAAVKVEDPTTLDLHTFGPAIERHSLFPEGINVAFFRILDGDNLEMRIWERGAGPTLACGTGACGLAVLCAKLGLASRQVNVHLPLATLQIDWAEDDHIYMTGPAAIVFEGEIPQALLVQP